MEMYLWRPLVCYFTFRITTGFFTHKKSVWSKEIVFKLFQVVWEIKFIELMFLYVKIVYFVYFWLFYCWQLWLCRFLTDLIHVFICQLSSRWIRFNHLSYVFFFFSLEDKEPVLTFDFPVSYFSLDILKVF